MFDHIRALSAERTLSASLERIDNPIRALRAAADAIDEIHRYEGLALLSETETWGRQEEARGSRAAEALAAITGEGPSGRGEIPQPSLIIPFGDDRGGRGLLSFISSDTIPLAAACSLERIAVLLSEGLRRLESTARLDASNKDRELLLLEMRHRNRNSLQLMLNLLPLIIPETPEMAPGVKDVLEERIGALLTLHSLFEWTDTGDKVSVLSYFTHLTDMLRSMAVKGIGTLRSEYAVDRKTNLSRERATTIGLIVHELVVNSVKHAQGAPLGMRLRLEDRGTDLVLTYRDRLKQSWVAEPAPEYKGSSGLGLGIIEGLLARAGGSRLDPGDSIHFFEACFPL